MPTGTSEPVSPSTTNSVVPGAAVATTGLRKSHGLEHDVRQSLECAGQDNQISRGHERRHVVAVAQKPHMIVQMIGMSRLFEAVAQRSVAGDQGARIGLDVLEKVERLQEIVDSFLVGQPAGEEDQRRAGVKSEAGANRRGSTCGGFSSSVPE